MIGRKTVMNNAMQHRIMGLNMSREEQSLARGIARPLEELERMWPHEILAMSMEDQADLADSVCREGAADPRICAQFLSDVGHSFPHEPPTNTTGVGNIAYLSLHAVDPSHRAEFSAVHKAYTLMLTRRYSKKHEMNQ